ncbi:MAG TPA: FAD-binding oxidoreductase [Mycobacteriales bacterium]|nr:FAD-binding oxidoreductase [Mycobacteriales bacterium]
MSYAVWGWGGAADEPRASDLVAAAPWATTLLGFPVQAPETPARMRPLAKPRIDPGVFGDIAGVDPVDRARHGIGRSYRDIVRGMRGEVPHVPDVVVRPTSAVQVGEVLDLCAVRGWAVVPFGGGSSVVGGVEPALPAGAEHRGVISLDLGRLRHVREVDPVSRAARIEAGALGPDLEAQLAETGHTLRFYPQSFERSTLGGWIATRAAGHYATGPTHIDDLVESVTAVTPGGGSWSSRRLPGSGAGPSPDRLLLGSEGTLGVITEAWVRLQVRPAHRAGTSVAFPSWTDGARAVRRIVQAGLRPAGCRLLDAVEARLTSTLEDGRAVLVLAFESADAPVDADLARAVEICTDSGGSALSGATGAQTSGRWRETFLRAPYLRENLVLLGVLTETFETAVTWDRFDDFVETVCEVTRSAVHRVCGAGIVTCRTTHAYPDGAAPYFTVLAPARRGSELAQWAEIKAAAADAIIAGGATITHHHAVGRDHRPWYDAQRPDLFANALRAVKQTVDPAGILNPGVLID